MTEASPFTLSFLKSHPRSAALQLVTVEPASAAGFLATVPTDIAGPVLARMPPWYGARIVEEMDNELIGKVLRAMVVSDAVPIMRLLDGGALEAILEHFPKRAAASYRNALTYPMWSVGAWMDRRVIALGEDQSVADAVAAFRGQAESAGNQCYVTGESGKFVGVIDLARLLRSEDGDALGDLADRTIATMHGRTRLSAAEALPDWDTYDTLPIVGRKGNPIGRLRRAVLRNALKANLEDEYVESASPLAGTTEAFVRTLPALINIVMSERPRTASKSR